MGWLCWLQRYVGDCPVSMNQWYAKNNNNNSHTGHYMFPWWFPGFRQILVFPLVRVYCNNMYEWIINPVWFWWTLETSLTYCFPDVQQQPALLSHPMAPPSPSTNSSTNNSSSSSTAGWEQLSKTNLYIRGLSPSTTDHDLVKLCQPWVPPSCVVLYYLPLIIHWFILVCTGCD